MAVDRDRTCANAGDGLQNLALLGVRTSSTTYAICTPSTAYRPTHVVTSWTLRPSPAFVHVRSHEFCRPTLQTPCFVTKITLQWFHNSLNVKMFTNTYRKCWFADVILFGFTVCSKFYTKFVITLHNGCMWLKKSKNTENSHGKCYKHHWQRIYNVYQ